MACNQCGNTTSSPCACKDTAYTIPANCLTGYSGQGCTDVSNTCEKSILSTSSAFIIANCLDDSKSASICI